MIAYWSKKILLGLGLAALGAGGIALLNRLINGEWALPALWVLVLSGFLFLAAPRGNSGYTPVGPDTPEVQASAYETPELAMSLQQSHKDYRKRGEQGGWRPVMGLAGAFLIALWLLFG